jgi:hypothetical protein
MQTMSQRKGKNIVSYLDAQELAEVLNQVLIRHPELRDEANILANDLLNGISVEAVSEEVCDMILGVGLEELGKRAGKQPWGYVEPGEAAWEILEESIEGRRNDMKRRTQVGLERSAEQLCQGIVIGLYNARASKCDGALSWAPDFAAEAAAQTVSNLIELYPPNRRRAAAKRIIAGVEEHAPEWLEMLYQVAERVVSSRKKVKKGR